MRLKNKKNQRLKWKVNFCVTGTESENALIKFFFFFIQYVVRYTSARVMRSIS